MSNPGQSPGFRVTRLFYRVINESAMDDFSHALPLSGHLAAWDFMLTDGMLEATPSEEFRSREAARADLEARLREWAQAAFLTPNAFRIGFAHDRSDVEVIDPQPGAVFVFPESAVGTITVGTPTVVIGHRTFPSPDPTFRRTQLTDLLSERLRAFRDGRAELPAVAYVVLSAVQTAFGSRAKCAAALAVDPPVLDTLGRLSSQYDPEIGRKAEGEPKPLTGQELAWLHAVIVRLVRRLGEHAAGAPLTQITLDDLPTLDD
jgi:hypothetical protein